MEHNDKIDEYGAPFLCLTIMCKCREKRLFFPTEENHNDVMSKMAPDEDEEDRQATFNQYGCSFVCRDLLCECRDSDIFFDTEEEHDRAMYPPDSSDEGTEEEEHDKTRFRCQRDWCICPPDGNWASETSHNIWVEQVKYKCEDEGCPCKDHRPFRTQEAHNLFFNMGSPSAANRKATTATSNGPAQPESHPAADTPAVAVYICKRKRCVCSQLGQTKSKKVHDSYIKAKQYVCWDEDCPCLLEDFFMDKEDHDEIMGKRKRELSEALNLTPQ
jgi:hypothetical protein